MHESNMIKKEKQKETENEIINDFKEIEEKEEDNKENIFKTMLEKTKINLEEKVRKVLRQDEAQNYDKLELLNINFTFILNLFNLTLKYIQFLPIFIILFFVNLNIWLFFKREEIVFTLRKLIIGFLFFLIFIWFFFSVKIVDFNIISWFIFNVFWGNYFDWFLPIIWTLVWFFLFLILFFWLNRWLFLKYDSYFENWIKKSKRKIKLDYTTTYVFIWWTLFLLSLYWINYWFNSLKEFILIFFNNFIYFILLIIVFALKIYFYFMIITKLIYIFFDTLNNEFKDLEKHLIEVLVYLFYLLLLIFIFRYDIIF